MASRIETGGYKPFVTDPRVSEKERLTTLERKMKLKKAALLVTVVFAAVAIGAGIAVALTSIVAFSWGVSLVPVGVAFGIAAGLGGVAGGLPTLAAAVFLGKKWLEESREIFKDLDPHRDRDYSSDPIYGEVDL